MSLTKPLAGAYDATSIAAAGLSTTRLRLDVAAANLANIESPNYKRRDIYQTAVAMPGGVDSFSSTLDGMTLNTPSVYAVLEDQKPARKMLQPGSPFADAEGYVSMPNINVVEEMTNMMTASRLYQANVTALQESRGMASEARKILTQA
jgi:flagellar basal-body rod protein FlgC